jgi:hypothetical protein
MAENTTLDWILAGLAVGILAGGLYMLVSGVLSMNDRQDDRKS